MTTHQSVISVGKCFFERNWTQPGLMSLPWLRSGGHGFLGDIMEGFNAKQAGWFAL